jgi:hypothetical protein
MNPRTYPLGFGHKFTEIAQSLIVTAGSIPILTDAERAKLDIKKMFQDLKPFTSSMGL